MANIIAIWWLLHDTSTNKIIQGKNITIGNLRYCSGTFIYNKHLPWYIFESILYCQSPFRIIEKWAISINFATEYYVYMYMFYFTLLFISSLSYITLTISKWFMMCIDNIIQDRVVGIFKRRVNHFYIKLLASSLLSYVY